MLNCKIWWIVKYDELSKYDEVSNMMNCQIWLIVETDVLSKYDKMLKSDILSKYNILHFFMMKYTCGLYKLIHKIFVGLHTI